MNEKERPRRIGERTLCAERTLREQARQALRRGYPDASPELIEHELQWFLGEDPGERKEGNARKGTDT